MIATSSKTLGMTPDTQLDSSEERRFTQLKRIEELKARLGKSPWTNPISSNHIIEESNDFTAPSPALSTSELSSVPSQDCPHLGHYSIKLEEAQSVDTEVSDWAGIKPITKVPSPIQQDAQPSYLPIELLPKGDSTTGSTRSSREISSWSTSSSHTPEEVHTTHIKQAQVEMIPVDGSAVRSDMSNDTSTLSSLHNSITPPQPSSTDSRPSPAKRRKIAKETKTLFSTLRARTSIPGDIPHDELARQSCEAALGSRLNPFVLHPEEYQILREHICHAHVSAYLNIRNRILRLWIRNPLVTVTVEEAAGCAYSSKWLNLAEVAYEWLVRRGYINFGCVDVPDLSDLKSKKRRKSGRKNIVVIGAGMAGLGCARQLDGLFNHFREAWTHAGEEPPRIIILEGRPRIGGRIYSHPLQNQSARGIPKHLRCTAETGAHIITGFSHGNPLNMIIRGQLALHYHPISDNDHLFDIDGTIVDGERDRLVEKLFNNILERTSLYRHISTPSDTVKGDQGLIEDGKDPSADSGKTISIIEKEQHSILNKPPTLTEKGLKQVHSGLDKLTGKANMIIDSQNRTPSLDTLKEMGWILPESRVEDISLHGTVTASENPTLGEAIDDGIKQYQDLLNLTPQDLRLLNWHIANLEYANAANLNKLSLGGWDQDSGNEFQGEHCQVIGGYTQVPRGIMQSPTPLDVRTRTVVTRIEYDAEDEDGSAKVHCKGGGVFDADHVVFTAPLGVLKHESIAFDPPLPSWKQASIGRLGFGLLNKVILIYEKPFWDVNEDMIGLLRDTSPSNSLLQNDYCTNRGRFYLFWNTIKTSGRPVLITMMAGDAAMQAEKMSDGEIIAEVTDQLANMYKEKTVPLPSEAIITRWGRDKFARGTYSNVGPEARSDDYDAIARRIGNLHFAGEATCATHPATVHGAYISGLRAAGEIIDDFLGPIVVPSPLVPMPNKIEPQSHVSSGGPVVKQEAQTVVEPIQPGGESEERKTARLEAFESEIIKAIVDKLGPRPMKPDKQGSNPFLLYSKDKWGECKAKCDQSRQEMTGNPQAKATRHDIRTALGLMWREASAEVKQPYIDQTVANRASNQESASSFQDRMITWDSAAMDIRREYVRSHPGVLSIEEEENMWQALGVYAGMDRKAKRASGYADTSEKLPL